MPKKPEENLKPTHGPKPEKHIALMPKPGVQEEKDKPIPKITHKHEQKSRVERDCTKCDHAVQVSDNEWECVAERYFPRTLICFTPREEV